MALYDIISPNVLGNAIGNWQRQQAQDYQSLAAMQAQALGSASLQAQYAQALPEYMRKTKWDYYTRKLLLVLDPIHKTRGSMQLIWAKHASDIMKIRDKYRSAYVGGKMK